MGKVGGGEKKKTKRTPPPMKKPKDSKDPRILARYSTTWRMARWISCNAPRNHFLFLLFPLSCKPAKKYSFRLSVSI